MTDTDIDDAMDDAVRRFWMDGEGDRCPDCSSPEIEARPHDGKVVLAYCPDCEFTFEIEGASFIRYDRLPEPFRDRADACSGHDEWNQFCPKCIRLRDRHESNPYV